MRLSALLCAGQLRLPPGYRHGTWRPGTAAAQRRNPPGLRRNKIFVEPIARDDWKVFRGGHGPGPGWEGHGEAGDGHPGRARPELGGGGRAEHALPLYQPNGQIRRDIHRQRGAAAAQPDLTGGPRGPEADGGGVAIHGGGRARPRVPAQRPHHPPAPAGAPGRHRPRAVDRRPQGHDGEGRAGEDVFAVAENLRGGDHGCHGHRGDAPAQEILLVLTGGGGELGEMERPPPGSVIKTP
ncbi:hypothetical protein Q9966_002923, partial [Columba livia]